MLNAAKPPLGASTAQKANRRAAAPNQRAAGGPDDMINPLTLEGSRRISGQFMAASDLESAEIQAHPAGAEGQGEHELSKASELLKGLPWDENARRQQEGANHFSQSANVANVGMSPLVASEKRPEERQQSTPRDDQAAGA